MNTQPEATPMKKTRGRPRVFVDDLAEAPAVELGWILSVNKPRKVNITLNEMLNTRGRV